MFFIPVIGLHGSTEHHSGEAQKYVYEEWDSQYRSQQQL